MTPGSCPFCSPEPVRLFHTDSLVLGLWDAFPVSPGHALLVTRRHTQDWFSATPAEQAALFGAVEVAKAEIEKVFQPDGYNLGLNIGAAGGQTIPHLHLHVIPRYSGDVPDPRGGVRHVVPHLANYLHSPDRPYGQATPSLPHGRALISGGTSDPLLPHLVAHMDLASAMDIAVSFSMQSGVRLLLPYLRELLERGGRVRILTGDYLGISEPNALRLLCDLTGDVQLRVFETGNISFHLKAYIAHYGPQAGTAFVGSSNLSRSALESGVEWNYRVITARDHTGFSDVVEGFERLFENPKTQELTPDWIEAYEGRRVPEARPEDWIPSEPPPPVPIPHSVQQEALLALKGARADGAGAGLVVLATGLGKTWLSAFDSLQDEFKRVLFVAHREEILTQALDTFRRIRPGAALGYYHGNEKTPEADVLFASIQTLGKQGHLKRFDRNHFDYIVVDEFHHAAASTYRSLIEYFQPKFMLGLTATPERTDGGDLLALCGENLVFRCDLVEGIRRGLLSPFDYYGVPDMVDFANIPWRSGRFDETELTNALATQARAENALEQYRKRKGSRAIGFCVSKRHADFMAGYFRSNGLRVASVHSGEGSDPRTHSLMQLEQGELDIIFAVDMFNEGVDLPQLDTVLMLRPTESQILWLQQFGRGLRKQVDKRLTVIDYIGNHRSFLVKPRTLLQLEEGDAAVSKALDLLQAGEWELPPGCSVTYELEATNILRALLRATPPSERLQSYYRDFREVHGFRPTATEAFHGGYDPKSVRQSHGSWLNFVRGMDDLTPAQNRVLSQIGEFLDSLEITPMTKSFKMVVLMAMLAEDAFPGAIAIDTLEARIQETARRYAVVRTEFGETLHQPSDLRRLLEANPLEAWVGGRGTGGTSYFTYEQGTFATTFSVPSELRESTRDLVRELVDWRMAVYARRVGGMTGSDRIVCKVSHSSGNPILFLPSRDRVAGIPQGWVDVVVDGNSYQANFVKIAINVFHQAENDTNRLPEILRTWFGSDAGQPGSTHSVELIRDGETYRMSPVRGDQEDGLRLWEDYARAKVPPHFGFAFKGMESQSGVVERDRVILLFVTLDKTQKPEAHRYDDGFVSPSEFRWQSQNRTARDSAMGKRIAGHQALGISVHLFVRSKAKDRGITVPFTYCGPLTFERWEGDKPISVWWQLEEPVPEQLWDALLASPGE